MKGIPNSTEVIIVPASRLVESGVLLASSPLVRGDTTTPIAQVITFDGAGAFSSLSIRHPTEDEIAENK